jgi:hypothetical protein
MLQNLGVGSWGSFSYLFGPLVAIAFIAVLVMVLRWSHGRPTTLMTQRKKVETSTDFGLLVPVASPGNQREADKLRANLESQDIKATITNTTDGLRILVWPHEVTRANQALSRETTAPNPRRAGTNPS